ncbi:M13 family metallopeptidase [Agilicoccus flavus]|uniref:M13 family metallopeptidase n=1 Tax=Agilicoccus flavus TaxID=2775968 RepID=UPI0027DA96FC|nr:M13-type metalloendopeptidase [Agilicoccus flavus]
MRSGIDTTGMDTTIRPQDDLFGYVNGGWVASTPIPDDKGRYGTFDMLRDQAQEHVRALIERAAAVVEEGGRSAAGAQAADPEVAAAQEKVGALFTSFTDTERIEAAGLEPVRADLAAVDAIDSATELFATQGRLMRAGVSGALAAYVAPDKRASDSYVVYLYQAGLGLPDEAYYREDQHAATRAAYVAHVERMFALAGLDDAAGQAAAVVALETRLARSHWDRVASRDAVKTYTKLTRAELTDLAPPIDLDAWADALGAPAGALDPAVVVQPSYLEGLSAAVEHEPLDAWRSWLRWHVLSSRAPYLPETFVEEDFDFFGRTLTGTPQNRERWRRGIGLVDMLLGEAAGRLYVAEHFSPESKERMLTLVDNLIAAYRQDISELAWMGEQTRAKALDKLGAFTPKIGYPDEWRDYSAYELDAADLVGNVARGFAFETDREFAKLGGPIDRGEWHMSPQTVNAYYNPTMNEIVFPAAILQPPFFDADADDAVNYGAIGSVIGHEIGHGFDDQGSRYDGAGNLAEWWTDDDRERFDALSGALIAQYSALSPRELPGEKVNGELTVGENIGDLGGVTIAHLAYRISLDGATPPVLDGLSGDQRFFAGWAQAWRGAARPEEARRLLALDPHSPMDLRANIVRNLVEFHEAFEVAPGDGLWLAEEDRVRIW